MSKITEIDDFFIDSLAISSGITTKSGLFIPIYFINLFYYSKVFRFDFIELWDSTEVDKTFIRKIIKANKMPYANNKSLYRDFRKKGHKSIYVEPYAFCFLLVHMYNSIGYKELPLELEQLYFRLQYISFDFIPNYDNEDGYE